MARVWDDSRVPQLARVFLILAPIYLLFPYDIHPDFLPGGFTDDLAVMPFLISVALLLIPSKVFRDAKRTAAAQAAVGIICLSFSVTELSEAKANGQINPLKCKGVCAMHLAGAAPLVTSADHRSTVSKFLNQNRPDIRTGCLGELGSAGNASVPADFRLTDVILIKRGGQYQLYAAEDNLVASNVENSYQRPMPPQLAGGIFIDKPIKFLSRKGVTC